MTRIIVYKDDINNEYSILKIICVTDHMVIFLFVNCNPFYIM